MKSLRFEMEEVSRLIETIESKAKARMNELDGLRREHYAVLEKLRGLQEEMRGAQSTIEELRSQLEQAETEKSDAPEGLSKDQIRMLVKEIDECINLLSK